MSKVRYMRAKEQLESEYMPVKHHSITLIDFIELNRKEELVEWFDKTFPPTITYPSRENPFREKQYGMLSGGSWSQIGELILNSDQDTDPDMHVTHPLGEPFSGLMVYGGQITDFNYFLAFRFILKSDQHLSKESYIDSYRFKSYTEKNPDGTEVRGWRAKGHATNYTCPKLIEYRQEAIKVLKGFGIRGLFLSEIPVKGYYHVPSVNIFSLERIDFGDEDYPSWRAKHHHFLDFLGLTYRTTRVLNSLIADQKFGFLGDNTIGQGLALLISESALSGTDETLADARWNMERFLLRVLTPLFHRVYWPIYQMKIRCAKYFGEIDRLAGFDLTDPDAPKLLPGHSQKVASVHHEFVDYRLSQEHAIQVIGELRLDNFIGMREITKHPLRLLDDSSITMDVIVDWIERGNRLRDKLRAQLNRIERSFASLTELYQMTAMLKLTEASTALEAQQINYAEQEERTQKVFNTLSLVLGVLVVFEVFGAFIAWVFPQGNFCGLVSWLALIAVLAVIILYIWNRAKSV